MTTSRDDNGSALGEYSGGESTHAAVIEVRGLTKTYGHVVALKALDLSVRKNSIFGFLGPNGAGKTTTMKLLLGLTRATSGSGSIFGKDILSEQFQIRRRVGYLAQDPRFYGHMTARETLRFVARFFYSGPESAIEWRVDESLSLVGLSDRADRRIRGFSGGELQRLGLAQAQINDPELLILDEPAASLDPMGRRDVLEIMTRLRDEQNTTIFYSTHILDDVQRVADSVAILDGGRLVRAAPTHELLESFTNDRLRVVLGGADDATGVQLAALAHVASVEPAERDGDVRAYLLRIRPEDALAVQRDVTRFAVDRDLTLMENGLVRLALEDVFLRLIDTKERAA
jgi:ABC-2 type transport system ATP-binding protein